MASVPAQEAPQILYKTLIPVTISKSRHVPGPNCLICVHSQSGSLATESLRSPLGDFINLAEVRLDQTRQDFHATQSVAFVVAFQHCRPCQTPCLMTTHCDFLDLDETEPADSDWDGVTHECEAQCECECEEVDFLSEEASAHEAIYEDKAPDQVVIYSPPSRAASSSQLRPKSKYFYGSPKSRSLDQHHALTAKMREQRARNMSKRKADQHAKAMTDFALAVNARGLLKSNVELVATPARSSKSFGQDLAIVSASKRNRSGEMRKWRLLAGAW